MKNRTSIYKNLQFRTGTGDAYYQIRITKNGIYYDMDKIVSCDVQQMLCGSGIGVEIGQACASTCTLVLFESSANWERMAKFTVSFRIVSGDGMENTSWYDIGQFYTDTRSEDNAGRLTIIAYDSMLLMEKTWTDSIPSEDLPASFPITARAWATLIQTHNLATFADLTQLDDTIAFVGLDTTSSIRDVLKSIATVHGGNWTVLANGNLSLIQYVNLVDDDPSDTEAYIDLGQAEENIETSPALPAVTGVHLETDAGTVMQYGSDSGYVVRAVCNVATTEGITEFCLTKVNHFVYKPFTAYNVCLDPAVELGDSVMINGVGYQVMALDLRLNGLITATVSAPYDQEVDHEYAVPNEDAKTYRKAMAAVEDGMSDYVTKEEHESSLVQTEQAITATVSATYVTQENYNTQIAEIQSQLDGSIQTWSGNAVPTLSNAPAVDWTTDADKATHVGDTYFVNSDADIPEAGSYYRFENNNGVYSWQLLNDTALTEALSKAAAAQAAAEAAQYTANGALTLASSANSEAVKKGRIFVVQPTPPYFIGDLWFNSTTSDIKVCVTPSNNVFRDSDWEKRDKYTDDSALTNFINNVYNIAIQSIQQQVDQKAETYYQDTDPSIAWGAAIAGIAVVGIDKIGVWGAEEHEGDLWFRTTDNTTWFFNGSEWVQQSVPQDVFDQIDGKAQIFVGQPYTPYRVGDLWFQSVNDDIKTCIANRLEGDFVEADWVKYNKYTDDTRANQVDQSLTTFKNTFSINPQDIRAEVEKRVIANKTETVNSFGWKLIDSAHIWYANGSEVARINQSGAYVKGEIRATTGYIGNENTGFKIEATSIRNGMTSRDDTTNNGIYVGTNGIALGKGNFKVTDQGEITAKSGTIGGFTITASSMYTNGQSSYSGTGNGIYMGSSGFRIGSKFKVDTAGNVTCGNITATNGTFEGTVYAKNVQYGGSAGTLNGGAIANNTLEGIKIKDGSITGSSASGAQGKIAQGSLKSLDIASGTITGGQGGNIASHTLADLNVVSSGYSPSALNSAIQGTLTSAGTLALGLNRGTASQLSYFAASQIAAITSVYAPKFTVADTSGGTNEYNLNGHYHSFTEQNGKIIIGPPNNATNIDQRSFNIANTTKYKTDVLASRAVLYCNATNYNDFDSGFDCDMTGDSYHYKSGDTYYGRIEIRNSYGNGLKTIRVKMPSGGSSSGEITIDLKATSQSVNPFYGTLPYYAYINNRHYVQISAVSTGVANRSNYIDINDIVNYAYEHGGGGETYYYWSDEKSGPYGSKQRDCYFVLNGSIVQTAKVIWSSGNPSFQ